MWSCLHSSMYFSCISFEDYSVIFRFSGRCYSSIYSQLGDISLLRMEGRYSLTLTVAASPKVPCTVVTAL
jgi:hypothetical protein